MKKSYRQDTRLFRDKNAAARCLALLAAVLLLPFLTDDYLLSQFTFIFMFSIAAIGLMLLTGYTGQISLGHAAFFAIGSYTSAILTNNGVPFVLALPAAGLMAGLMGIIIGLPALRLSGLYLAIATMGFAFIVEEVLSRWESLTNGNQGMTVEPASIGPLVLESEIRQYYLALVILCLAVGAAKNLLRSPVGRALIAIRDSEVAAQAVGVNLAKFKTMAFAISAAFTGIAGGLYAHKLFHINPESYTILVSIELLAMIIIGGLGTIPGAILGAAFVILLPQLIAAAKDFLPDWLANQTGLEPAIYGLMIVLFIIFEPQGIYGRWLKIKYYFENFPLYKKDTFRKAKKYQKAGEH
ncbi:MAG: branched-chain amino acid ABC transporter permease [Proteobacteria bacterium]|nr:branched-chain amino acid ABC transporter permease [Pseudomonadota bacterium]MBU1742269.1 branched-chain amino acid ABC transporter permease [Pseudomonadota bacterium]